MTEGWGGCGSGAEETETYGRDTPEWERLSANVPELARRLEERAIKEAAIIASSAGAITHQREIGNVLAALRIARLLASADTRPKGGDGTAPFTSGAVPKADAQGDA